ncbi:MMPL family protein, partial [Mycobacterium xenopi 3993]
MIATLGHFGYIELSSFAVNIVVALTLGAGTDYGIFLWAAITRRDRPAKAGRTPSTSHTRVSRPSSSLGADHRRGMLLLDFRTAQLLPHHGPAVGIAM